MSNFPILSKQDLDSGQRDLWDDLTLGPRGFYTGGPDAKRVPDLYNAWLQFPGFGRQMLRMADEIRARSELTGRLRELIVLTTSIQLGVRVEYDFHVPFALNEGLPQDVIDAIGEGVTPEFTDETDRVTYEANLQLLRTATLSEDTRRGVVEAIGHRGLMQLMAVVGFYVIVSYTSNVAGVRLADDFSADPQKLKDFYAGKSADRGES